MATIQRDGLVLELPDYVSVAVETRGEGRRRGLRAAEPGEAVSPDEVARALTDAGDLILADSFALNVNAAAAPPPGRRGKRGVPPSPSAQLSIDVGADEHAVVLVEQDGYYSWVTGTKVVSPSARRGPAASVVTFSIPIETFPQGEEPARRGLLSQVLIKPITTIVFKFVAHIVVGQFVKRLEQSVQTGLVKITGPDPLAWIKPPQPQQLELPAHRRGRVLLLLHGTFSSTRGGFGSLAATDAGKQFLQKAVDAYDLVLGFDHPTLSADPMENAEELLAQLRALASQSGVDVDAVTHSRGALVLRSLVEQLLPPEDKLVIRNAAMVAGPNAGTLLASPPNWSTLVDLYTNLVVAGCRLIALAGPAAATAGTILAESLQAVAILVKAIVADAADEQRVPGLAAMVPGGAFITAINKRPVDGAEPPTGYYTVSSDFQVKGLSGPKELPAKLVRLLSERFVDELMGADNDLVVDVASMTSVDPGGPNVIRQSFALGVNSQTYHCSYFLEPKVLQAIEGWLFEPPPGDGGVNEPTPLVGQVVYNLPGDVDTNVAVIDADAPIGVVTRRICVLNRDFAVVRLRKPGGEPTYYALTPEEFIALTENAPAEITLSQSGLLQGKAPSAVSTTTRITHSAALNVDAPWTTRTVVILDGSPVGVAPPADEQAAAEVFDRPVTRGVALERLGPPSRWGDEELEPLGPATVSVRGAYGPQPAEFRGVPKPAQAVTAQAYFRAETDDVIKTTEESLVLVDISLDELDNAVTADVQLEKADVDVSKPITVNIVPRVNLKVIGDKFAAVDPPRPGDSRSLRFSVTGVRPGPGQLLVIAGQGPVDLVKMVLDVTVADEQASVEIPQRAAVAAIIPPTPSVAACDQLIIDENKTVVLTGAEGHQQETVVETRFDVRYLSESLDYQERAETKPFEGDRLRYVTDLYRQIEADWGNSNADAQRFNRALRAFGGQLFDELLPESIQKVLWDNRDTIKQIQINSIDPLIPWEILHLKGPNHRLPSEERFLANMGLVRWIDGAHYPPQQVGVARGHASVISPSYPVQSGWQLSGPAEEFKFLEKTFGATMLQADVETIMSMIEQPGQFDLLHFAGHGMAEPNDISNAELVIQVRQQNGQWVPVPLTATMVEQFANLREGRGNRPLVFLNACQAGRAGYQLTKVGGFAQAFLKGGAGVFVSTLWSVVDEPARKFTEEFYTALIDGKTGAQAATCARQNTHAAGDPTWLAYVVYGRPDGRLVLR